MFPQSKCMVLLYRSWSMHAHARTHTHTHTHTRAADTGCRNRLTLRMAHPYAMGRIVRKHLMLKAFKFI